MMLWAIQYAFAGTHFEWAGCSYFDGFTGFYRDPGLNSHSGVEEYPALEILFSKKGIVAGCGAAEHLCHTVEQL